MTSQIKEVIVNANGAAAENPLPNLPQQELECVAGVSHRLTGRPSHNACLTDGRMPE